MEFLVSLVRAPWTVYYVGATVFGLLAVAAVFLVAWIGAKA